MAVGRDRKSMWGAHSRIYRPMTKKKHSSCILLPCRSQRTATLLFLCHEEGVTAGLVYPGRDFLIVAFPWNFQKKHSGEKNLNRYYTLIPVQMLSRGGKKKKRNRQNNKRLCLHLPPPTNTLILDKSLALILSIYTFFTLKLKSYLFSKKGFLER